MPADKNYFPTRELNQLLPKHVVAALVRTHLSAELAAPAQTSADAALAAAVAAQATADAAQSAAATALAEALRASIYGLVTPPSTTWNSTAAGVFLAGNPTRDITINFYNNIGVSVASRVLRGTMTSATGVIAVTSVSSTTTTGYSTSYALVGDGTKYVRADVTLTMPTGTVKKYSASWNSIDESVAGGGP